MQRTVERFAYPEAPQEKGSGRIFGTATKIGKAAFKVGRTISLLGDAMLFGAVTGAC